MNVFIKNKLYRMITLSDCLSVIGDSLFYLALIAYANKLSHSVLAVTIVTLSETIPPFLSFYTGYLVDITKNKAEADILSNFFRFIIYLTIAFILYLFNGIEAIFMISVLNIISDLIGSYSDNLRFPIVYSIIPEEDMEESFSFSNISYYLFSFGSKFLGGILLLIFNSHYITFSLLNSLTFLIAAFIMLYILKPLNQKMKLYEKSNAAIKGNENVLNERNRLTDSIGKLISNKKMISIIIRVAISNALVACVLPMLYIYFTPDTQKSSLPYELMISLLGVISVIGIILGNWFSTKARTKISINGILNLILISVAIIGSLMFFSNIEIVMYSCIFMLYCQVGFLSPKFSLYLMSNQEYESLGVSSGVINTLLAIITPFQLAVMLLVANAFGLGLAQGLLILFVAVYLIVFNKLEEII